MVDPLVKLFPGLTRGGYRVTSPKDNKYNCVAHAAGQQKTWWWPDPPNFPEFYWPTVVERAETIPAFRAVFTSLGYEDCGGENLEPGFEKVALFAKDQVVPLHAARQMESGRWTSKLGELEDIEHDLRDLEGVEYGTVALLMKRSVSTRTPERTPEPESP